MQSVTKITLCLLMLSATTYLYSNTVEVNEETTQEWTVEQFRDYFHKKLIKFKQKHINAKLISNTLDIENLLAEQAQRLAIAQIQRRDQFYRIAKELLQACPTTCYEQFIKHYLHQKEEAKFDLHSTKMRIKYAVIFDLQQRQLLSLPEAERATFIQEAKKIFEIS